METIKIKGINRDPRNDEHGVCQEIINLRFKDGSWLPVGKKHTESSMAATQASIVFIHNVDPDTDPSVTNKGKNFLGYNDVTGRIITWEPENPAVQTTIGTIDSGKSLYLSFIALKNIVVIIDREDNNLYYLIWKDSAYTFLNGKFPELVRLIPSATFGIQHTQSHNASGGDSFRAEYNTTLTGWRETGHDEGYTMVRYAYELYDGSIVCHSAPILMSLDPSGRHISTSSTGQPQFTLNMYGGKVNYTDGSLETQAENSIIFNQLQTTYKHIVKNIVFYMTKPVPSNRVNEMGWNNDLSVFNSGLANGTPFSEASKQEIFYKVFSLTPLEASLRLGLPGTIIIEAGNLNNYEGREIMPQDDFTHHNLSAGANMIYNGRLILGNITTRLFNGYCPDVLFTEVTSNTIAAYYIDLYVRINTEEGEKNIARLGVHLYDQDTISCPAVISYPDIRASGIDVVKRTVTGDNYLITTYGLSPANSNNFSYCLVQQDIDTPVTLDFDPGVPATYIIPDLTKNTYTDRNMSKLSGLNNPFVFPAKNSYLVGLNEILAFEVNAIPVSTGQFGQYPILVFTNSGMWSMELGSGEVVISNIVPLNDLICTNPSAITRAGNMIVFPTGEGLIALGGQTDALISQPLRGDYASQLISKTELSTVYLNHDSLVRLSPSLSSVDFSLYLENISSVAGIAYDQNNRELIVSNPAYNYSYVYSFTNNTWTKITDRFRYFIKDYPKTFGVDHENNLVDITTEDSGDVETLIITRPIYFDQLVKLMRLGLKSKIDLSTDDPTRLTGLYMYGSFDGRNWNFITGIQKSGDFNNPYVNRSLMTFREVIIVFAAKLRSTSYIRDIVIDIKARFTNKPIR